eukprot:13372089-Alexandrium_andersonii.AAC.1
MCIRDSGQLTVRAEKQAVKLRHPRRLVAGAQQVRGATLSIGPQQGMGRLSCHPAGPQGPPPVQKAAGFGQ